ncbi:hypothetical protein IG631_15807 [Alternaria alternata]|nr:hypothetical protein IG631_15807 [Alternaria alternata]
MASQITDRKHVRRTESSLGAASDGVSHYDDFLVKLSIVRCPMMESRSRAWEHDAPRLCFRPVYSRSHNKPSILANRDTSSWEPVQQCVYQHSLFY